MPVSSMRTPPFGVWITSGPWSITVAGICAYLPSLHGGEGSSSSALVSPNDTLHSKSAVGMNPGDPSVVAGYQVGEFTHTWSVECFIDESHIYPGFTGKVSSLIHFRLEPGCDNYSFLDQEIVDFIQGLDSILTDYVETPELDSSFEKPDIATSSVFSGFLHSISTISDTSKLQLPLSIKSHNCAFACIIGRQQVSI